MQCLVFTGLGVFRKSNTQPKLIKSGLPYQYHTTSTQIKQAGGGHRRTPGRHRRARPACNSTPDNETKPSERVPRARGGHSEQSTRRAAAQDGGEPPNRAAQPQPSRRTPRSGRRPWPNTHGSTSQVNACMLAQVLLCRFAPPACKEATCSSVVNLSLLDTASTAATSRPRTCTSRPRTCPAAAGAARLPPGRSYM